MAPWQSRSAWLAVGDEETQRAVRTAGAAEAIAALAPVRRFATAVLVTSGLASALLSLAPWPRSTPQSRAVDAADITGLSEQAKPGSFLGKTNALISAQQASPGSGKGWWIVVRPAILREGMSLDTPKVAVLRTGEHLLVSEVRGRRAHIGAPKEGWVSVKTSRGEPILAPPDLGLGSVKTAVAGFEPRPPQPRQGNGSDAWKGMSALELREAMAKGQVDPSAVLASGFGKLSGFLNQTNKVLDKYSKGLAGKSPQPPGAAGLPTASMAPGAKSGEELMPQLQMPLFPQAAEGAAPGIAGAEDAEALGTEALSVADKLLRKEGKSLEDATKGLTTNPRLAKLMNQVVRQREAAIARARATSVEAA